ncbi:hypothetical protein GCM10011496_39020 [Polaromonas eurypsychrophila]|uniref:Uncharacterized protein n=1 Tax=Polaromonas eurypsychrophila TaxID=1614635 RepID=A0A916WNC0_9BURK|nr:hypothetical protein GCM10011496_39020 [Polaromonas eurypsychrophila]
MTCGRRSGHEITQSQNNLCGLDDNARAQAQDLYATFGHWIDSNYFILKDLKSDTFISTSLCRQQAVLQVVAI